MEDVAVSADEGVVFVDTRDLPPPEAVIPVTPVKGSSRQQQESASSASDTLDRSGSAQVGLLASQLLL